MHALLAALVLRALFHLPLPIPGTAALFILACGIGSWLYRRETGFQQVVHDGQGRWSWCDRGHWYGGVLASGCYRSRLLVVLAMIDDNGRTRRSCLWRDSLSTHEFSYLQLQLLLVERETLGN